MNDSILWTRDANGLLSVTGNSDLFHLYRDGDLAVVTDGHHAVVAPWESGMREHGDRAEVIRPAVRKMMATPAPARGYIDLADALQWAAAVRVDAYGYDAQACLGYAFNRRLLGNGLRAMATLGVPDDAEVFVETYSAGDEYRVLRMSSMFAAVVALGLRGNHGKEPMPTRPRSSWRRAA